MTKDQALAEIQRIVLKLAAENERLLEEQRRAAELEDEPRDVVPREPAPGIVYDICDGTVVAVEL